PAPDRAGSERADDVLRPVALPPRGRPALHTPRRAQGALLRGRARQVAAGTRPVTHPASARLRPRAARVRVPLMKNAMKNAKKNASKPPSPERVRELLAA